MRQHSNLQEVSLPSASCRTVIIEDQVLFKDLLVRMLENAQDCELVGACREGEEGWDLCQREKPDLVLLDIQLPDCSGVEIARRIADELPSTRVMALSSLTDKATVEQVLDAGVAGYVEKDQEIDYLENAIGKVAAGGTYFAPAVLRAKREAQEDPDALTKILSPREREVLTMVAEGETSKTIAEKLDLSTRTIENHRYHIMRKLELEDTASLVKYAIRQNLVQ